MICFVNNYLLKMWNLPNNENIIYNMITSPVATTSTSKFALGQSYGGGVISYIFLP